jgi:hypothetical protein
VNDVNSLNIFIAVPSYGGWTRNACTQSLMLTTGAFASAGIKFGGKICNITGIDQVRNLFGSLMMEMPQYTHLLFVDNDMAFHSDTIIKLINAEKAVIGAVCSGRKNPPVPNIWSDTSPTRPLDKVLGIGMGVTLIETQVFRSLASTGQIGTYKAPGHFTQEGLRRQVYRFFDHIERDGEEWHEDHSFCMRWRELCGGEVWALSGERIGHIGDMVYELPVPVA